MCLGYRPLDHAQGVADVRVAVVIDVTMAVPMWAGSAQAPDVVMTPLA